MASLKENFRHIQS